jgi:hypothetical protein
MEIILIPGRLTWLLQPLDTHVFAKLKLDMYRSYMKEKMGSADGVINMAQWVSIILKSVSSKLTTPHFQDVFEKNGIAPNQSQLRPKIAKYNTKALDEARILTEDEFTMFIGQKRKIYAMLFKLTNDPAQYRDASKARQFIRGKMKRLTGKTAVRQLRKRPTATTALQRHGPKRCKSGLSSIPSIPPQTGGGAASSRYNPTATRLIPSRPKP